MALGYSNYLSLSEWISEVIGGFILSLLIGLVVVNYLCVKNNIGAKSIFVLNLLTVFAFLGVFYSQNVLVLVVSILPLLIYGVYAAFWK